MTRPRTGTFTQELPPSYCGYCDMEVPESHWRKEVRRSGFRWRCHKYKRDSQKASSERRLRGEALRVVPYTDIEDRELAIRVNALCARTRLDRVLVVELISGECTYCGSTAKLGIDRIDSTYGYEPGNVTPCCFPCNNLLTDLPMLAKRLLSPGLRACREQGVFTDWVPALIR